MPRDYLNELTCAVAHLQEVLHSMGPGIELSRITVSDGRRGNHFDTVMRSSPSFREPMLYPDARNSPQVSEILGVKIEVIGQVT
jgi:hypothetical protein